MIKILILALTVIISNAYSDDKACVLTKQYDIMRSGDIEKRTTMLKYKFEKIESESPTVMIFEGDKQIASYSLKVILRLANKLILHNESQVMISIEDIENNITVYSAERSVLYGKCGY